MLLNYHIGRIVLRLLCFEVRHIDARTMLSVLDVK